MGRGRVLTTYFNRLTPVQRSRLIEHLATRRAALSAAGETDAAAMVAHRIWQVEGLPTDDYIALDRDEFIAAFDIPEGT